MTDITIIDNEYASLVYHEDTKIVHHTFHQPVGGEKFRQILEAGVPFLEKYGATKWLSDDRLNSELSAEDTKWATQEWFKQSQDAGWKSWALVVPMDIFARLNLIEHVNHYSKRGIRVMVFTDVEQALAWLEPLEN